MSLLRTDYLVRNNFDEGSRQEKIGGAEGIVQMKKDVNVPEGKDTNVQYIGQIWDLIDSNQEDMGEVIMRNVA